MQLGVGWCNLDPIVCDTFAGQLIGPRTSVFGPCTQFNSLEVGSVPAKPKLTSQVPTHALTPIDKAPTGIRGLDEITNGGLPRGRTTIFCGGPGSGKTMLGIEFLVRGAAQFDEP